MADSSSRHGEAARLGDVAGRAALLLLVILPSVWLTKDVVEPFKATTEFLVEVLAWVAAGVFVAAVGPGRAREAWRRQPVVAGAGWMLTACFALSAGLAWNPGVSWRYAIVAAAWVVVGMAAWGWLGGSTARREKAIVAIAVVWAWQAACGLGQMARLPLSAWLGGARLDLVAMLDVGARAGRPIGTLGNYNYLAEWIVLVTPPVAMWLFVRARGGRVLAGILLVSAGVLLYGAGSRAAWLSVVVGLAAALMAMSWFYWSRRRVTVSAIAVLLVGLVGAVAPWPAWLAEPSVSSRLASWRVALQLFVEHPVFGVGLGGFKLMSVQTMVAGHLTSAAAAERLLQVHNEPLQGLAELGLVGTLTAAVMVMAWSGAVARNTAWPVLVRFGFLWGMWALVVVSCFGFPLHIPLTALALVILMALGVAGSRAKADGPTVPVGRAGVWWLGLGVVALVALGWDAWPNYQAHRAAHEADRHRQAGNWPAAEAAYRGADQGMRFKGRLRWYWLEALVRQGKYAEAVDLFEASAKEGLGVDAVLWYGRALEGLDRVGDAIAAYRRVTGFFPAAHPLHALAQQRIDGLTSTAP